MEVETRRAWVDVDLGALRQNALAMGKRAGKPLVPMIKADGYGLGAVAIARALDSLDPWAFGVATLSEAEALRAAGVARRILIFTPLLPWDLDEARRLGATPTLGAPDVIRAWIDTGGGEWHLAIDTGMHRAGVPWWRVGEVFALAREHPPEGAFTHFHSADVQDGSHDVQQQRFLDAVGALPGRPRFLHAENSPAIEHWAPSPWDLARPGVFLYGVGSAGNSGMRPEPVAHLRARIVELRDVPDGEAVSYGATWRARGKVRVATVAAGYADGYRRSLSNRGFALVHGRRVPVAGRVTMDMTMLDVTGLSCAVGEVATLMGRDGDQLLDVNEVARVAELSPYELLVGLGLRAARRYLGEME